MQLFREQAAKRAPEVKAPKGNNKEASQSSYRQAEKRWPGARLQILSSVEKIWDFILSVMSTH